jgi:hypothetical protein
VGRAQCWECAREGEAEAAAEEEAEAEAEAEAEVGGEAEAEAEAGGEDQREGSVSSVEVHSLRYKASSIHVKGSAVKRSNHSDSMNVRLMYIWQI